MKTVAIIQARIQSTRLPAKVLCDIEGKTMLQRVVERVSQAKRIDEVVVATSNTPADEILIEHCKHQGWSYFAGSESDVLSRYWLAANACSADQVVRITSDCPLIDPEVIDSVVEVCDREDVDYACNFFPLRYFPRGLDCEIIRLDALRRVHEAALADRYREHVTLYIYDSPQSDISIGSVVADVDHGAMRWTVDTPEDLELVREIYRYFGESAFSWHDVLDACSRHPGWMLINSETMQKVA